MQPDSIIPNAGNPQAWNRFSYVNNSPIDFNDPTGHAYCDFINNQNKEDCTGGESRIATSGSSGGNSGGGNNNDDDIIHHGGGSGNEGTTLTPITNGTQPITTTPTITPTGTPPSFTNSPANHQIDWAKVSEGTGLLILLGALDYALILGVAAFLPEIATAEEITIIIGVDSPWIMVGSFALIDAHISALNLIYEGFTGEKNKIPKLLVPRK